MEGMHVTPNEDGGVTISFDSHDAMTRCSSCTACGERIGTESYAEVRWPMARCFFHTRCVRQEDAGNVLHIEPAKDEPIHGDDLPRPDDEPDVPMMGDRW